MSRPNPASTEIIWNSVEPEPAAGPRFSRPVAGALLGLLFGIGYSLTAGTIDAVLMRDVPLRVDWPAVWMAAAAGGAGGAALGALTAWPANGWLGAVAGAAGFIGWYFLQAVLRLRAAVLLFVPFYLPLLVMCLPLAAGLRWATRALEQTAPLSGWARWRAQSGLCLAFVFVSLLAGSCSQMPASAQAAVRQVDQLVQRQRAAPAGAPLPTALNDTPDIVGHLAQAYTLDQETVTSAAAQVDVHIRFADGYALSCLVDQQSHWVLCRPGVAPLYNGAPADTGATGP